MTDRSSLSGHRFAMRLRLARFALLWERVWPPCWPALGALGAFLVLGLFDVLPNLPGLLHAAILFGLGAAFAIGLAAAFGKTVIPDAFSARRRIEQASGLQHRPLQALADRPSRPPDVAAARLWEAHRRRMEAGGAPTADRAAACWVCRPRSVGVARGPGDPAAARRDRRRERMEGSSRPVRYTGYSRQVGDGRREVFHILGDAR